MLQNRHFIRNPIEQHLKGWFFLHFKGGTADRFIVKLVDVHIDQIDLGQIVVLVRMRMTLVSVLYDQTIPMGYYFAFALL